VSSRRLEPPVWSAAGGSTPHVNGRVRLTPIKPAHVQRGTLRTRHQVPNRPASTRRERPSIVGRPGTPAASARSGGGINRSSVQPGSAGVQIRQTPGEPNLSTGRSLKETPNTPNWEPPTPGQSTQIRTIRRQAWAPVSPSHTSLSRSSGDHRPSTPSNTTPSVSSKDTNRNTNWAKSRTKGGFGRDGSQLSVVNNISTSS
jgi:hypothetical protein